jgi:hypothetical protein
MVVVKEPEKDLEENPENLEKTREKRKEDEVKKDSPNYW